jgi:hypothetical protein
MLPWQATDNHPVLQALRWLQDLYAHEQRHLPEGTRIFRGRVWQEVLTSSDRERAFCAFKVATLLALRRALRNGTVWIDHSLAFRSQERLFIPADGSQAQRRPYFRRLRLPTDPAVFLEPCVERAEAGMTAVPPPQKAGTLRVDDELHLTPLAAEEEDPQVAKLRAALDRWIGEAGAGADSCGCHSIVRIGDSPGEFALHERRTTPCSRRSVRLRREGVGSGPIGVLAS